MKHCSLQITLSWVSPVLERGCCLILVGILLALPAKAFAGFSFDTASNGFTPVTELQKSKVSELEELQEVAPPGGVQQLREELSRHHPQLTLDSPSKGEILLDDEWEIVLNVKDWPLVQDPELGIGPHVVIQLDQLDPIRVAHTDGSILRIPMPHLTPGSHRGSIYAAYPWGESVKEHGANIQFRVHYLRKTNGTQPEKEDIWINTFAHSNWNIRDPFLIDYIIWNAPLQGLKEGDDRWKLRITVNDKRFMTDRQDAIWLRGLMPGLNLVQIELLDQLGEPIKPFYNNQVKKILFDNSPRPIWTNLSIGSIEMDRILGNKELEASQINPDQGVSNEYLIEAEKNSLEE